MSIDPTPSEVSAPAKAKKNFISPTSSFIDFAELETEYFTEEGRSYANLYSPHHERKLKKPTTDFETCVHLLKGSVGAGILAMPKAFYHAGVAIGIIGTILLAASCVYAMDVMIRMQLIQCKRLRVPFMTLPRSMRIAFLNGPRALSKLAWVAPALVDFFLIFYQLGICTAYVVFIAGSIKDIVEPRLLNNVSVRLYTLLLLTPLVLINFIRNLKRLTPVSLLANILTVLALSACFYYIFFVGPFKLDEVNVVSTVRTWPLFIGTVLFALEAIGVIIALEHNMEKPQHFLGRKGLFPWSMLVVSCMYMAVGLLGYLKFGKGVKETIVASLPNDEWLSLTIAGVYAFCIFCSYPLQCYVSLEILWGNYLVHLITDPHQECCVEYILRTVVVIITVLIPYVDIMISLVGAFCLSTLGMIFPFLLELCTMWPNELGRFYYVFFKDIFFIIVGFFILVIGTYVSLYTLITREE